MFLANYYRNGQLASYSDPSRSGAAWMSYAYDSLNRLTTTVDAFGDTTIRGYDSGGNLTSVTDPLGQTTQDQYDSRDRLTTLPPGSGDGAGHHGLFL